MPARSWRRALLHALPLTLLVLGLFFYWFAVADRCAIFLYGHLNATPFDRSTSSRYWMSGLVAAGAVLVVYTLTNWLMGRLAVRLKAGLTGCADFHVSEEDK